MKTASCLVLLLAASPVFAAGRGGASASRGRASARAGRGAFAFRPQSNVRFAARASSFGSGRSGFGSGLRGFTGSRAERFNSSASAVGGNVPLTGGGAQTRGNPGAPIVGTMLMSSTVGAAGPTSVQGVSGGGFIAPTSAAPQDVGRSPGIMWQPIGAGAATLGGNGATTNGPAPSH
jgi:hypothetical protein